MNMKLFAMTKELIIGRTLKATDQLPDNKAEETADFADFISKRCEEQRLAEGIQQLLLNSQTFNFLKDEEDLYSKEDLKKLYND